MSSARRLLPGSVIPRSLRRIWSACACSLPRRSVLALLPVLALGITTAASAKAELPPPAPPVLVDRALQQQRLEAVERVMLHLNAGERDTAMIEEVYASDARFIDPVFPEGLEGHQALLDYHTALNGMIESFTVDVREVMPHGDSILVFWSAEATMAVKLGLGEALRRAGLPDLGLSQRVLRLGPVHNVGVTRFDFARRSARIARHTDYYDGIAQYEAIPVLKHVLGAVRQQMRKALSRPAASPGA